MYRDKKYYENKIENGTITNQEIGDYVTLTRIKLHDAYEETKGTDEYEEFLSEALKTIDLTRELQLTFLQNKYEETGSGAYVLEALDICCSDNAKPPQWVRSAFCEAYNKAKNRYEVKSWDEVFEPPHPKGSHLSTKQEHAKNLFRVFRRINEIRKDEPETPIDGYLFERVGRELGLGSKTKIEGIYYEFKNLYEIMPNALKRRIMDMI